ncbi:MAG: hypothetical protein AB1894_14535 [Chloroflexota bacterium]
MNSPNIPLLPDQRKVFILRVAFARSGVAPKDGIAQWRGQLQNVYTGEKYFFQGVDMLNEILRTQLKGDWADASPDADKIRSGLR